MTILYGVISRGTDVLVEHTNSVGNFSTVTRTLLSRIPPLDAKKSWAYDSHYFHFVVSEGITFMCMADAKTKHRVAFTFLESIRDEFLSMFGEVAHTALAFSLNEPFCRVLQQRMNEFNVEDADELKQVRSQIDGLKDIMIDDIEKILERGEKIELLVDRTESLNNQGIIFRKSAKATNRSMKWRKIRMYILFMTVGIGIALFVAISICGGVTFNKCLH